MGIQKSLYQKPYELQAGSQEFTVDFKGCERQFDWLEISLVYDKSDKHLIIYDSYNAEWAARMIRNIKLANISNAYSATNTMKRRSETLVMEAVCCVALQRIYCRSNFRLH